MARYDITYAHAKKLWKNRDKERPTIIWPSDDNKHAFIIPRSNIYKSLRKAAAELGITEFHPHQMRHTWATRLLEEGINEFELMQRGGWSTIAMVRRYAKVNVVKLSPKIRKALANKPSGEVRTDRHCLTTADAPLTDVYRQPCCRRAYRRRRLTAAGAHRLTSIDNPD